VRDRIPEDLTFTERTRDLTALDTTYHAQHGVSGEWGKRGVRPDARPLATAR
jgi:hypothetical protein